MIQRRRAGHQQVQWPRKAWPPITIKACFRDTGSEGNFTIRMVNYFEFIKGLHYIIGAAGELIIAVGITLHQWPLREMNQELHYITGPSGFVVVHRV